MKRLTAKGLVILMGLVGIAVSAQADELKSLRGNRDIEEGSAPPEMNRLVDDDRPILRNYVKQPPLIPHKTEGYRINRNYNKCLSCHSWANYQQARATKIPPTHFTDRDGKELANISASRYFCTQCHVPQTDSRPLVENEFEPVKALK